MQLSWFARALSSLVNEILSHLRLVDRLPVPTVSIHSHLVNIILADRRLSSRLVRHIEFSELFPIKLLSRYSRHFNFSCLDEVLHGQVLHFHVPCSLGQTVSLRQRSCCLAVASQFDLGSHAEIAQDCFHVQSICASCSERVELAFYAALRMRVCSFIVVSSGWSLFRLPVPILCCSSLSMCSRSVGVSLGHFDCTRGLDFSRIRFAGVYSPRFSNSSLPVSGWSVSLMSVICVQTVELDVAA